MVIGKQSKFSRHSMLSEWRVFIMHRLISLIRNTSKIANNMVMKKFRVPAKLC
jgi:hypothetical protein